MKPPITVAAFYLFVPLSDLEERREILRKRCEENGVKGTILLAKEGINSTIAGPTEGMENFLSFLTSDPLLTDLVIKRSYNDQSPFYRLKVRIKNEIVNLRVPGIDPNRMTGEYVQPDEWNDLISRDDVRVIDTRNEFEFDIGTFKGAEDPHTKSFHDFPEYVEKELDPEKDESVAMFCTGGIRCEKATAFLLEKGFKNVFQLDGGILRYLEEVPEEKSLWAGECFVFDQRVTVDHQLNPGRYDLCHGCWQPINEEDRQTDQYISGVACPRCFDTMTPEKRRNAEERVKQIHLARARNEEHLGRELPTSRGRPKPELLSDVEG
jgi:UPF0176 protein